MGPRQRKKGQHEKDEAPVNSEQVQQAARKKLHERSKNKKKRKHTNALYYWISIIAGVCLFGWLFAYISNLSSEFLSTDPATRAFLDNFVCHDAEGGYCSDKVAPYRRTQKAKKRIAEGERVLTVPRHLQIWDLDSLRDEFVREELHSARHVRTNNPLHSGAFLAAYLARRVYLNKNETKEDDPMRPYFDLLPTFHDLEAFHPALWGEERLNSLIKSHSWSFTIVRAYQDMLRSEYAAFVHASSEFASTITEAQYKTMRINVMSRSFGTGPPTQEEALPDQSLEDELDLYKQNMGVDLNKGCHAMVPILDMYDHHPRPNVGWKYSSEERAFVIDAIRSIPPGQVIIDSYGVYSDVHLFSKFGFLNGDGSGHTEISIAAMHKPLDVGMREQFTYLAFSGKMEDSLEKYQRELIVRYLVFDDGFDDCIQKELHPEAYEFKKLKLELVNRIANDPKRWLLTMQPRTETSLPAKTTEVPITFNPPDFDMKNLNLKASKIIETCRLIALGPQDYDGNATQVMKEAVESGEPLIVENQGNNLEYRALAVLSRLSGVARGRHDTEMDTEMRLVRELTIKEYQSPLWNVAQLRLGEIQTLEVIHRVAFSGVMEMANRIQDEAGTRVGVVPHIRETPCPSEFTQVLLDEEKEEGKDKVVLEDGKADVVLEDGEVEEE